MPDTQYEAGYISSDEQLHAVKKRIDGASALCGAGRVVQTVPGRFDSDDPRACPACVAAVAGPSA
jgi:hypothetical protein